MIELSFAFFVGIFKVIALPLIVVFFVLMIKNKFL
jgi:hypothetical protein